MDNEIAKLEQEIRDLMAMLSCSSSDIGDWKIAKCIEYQLVGKDLPYDLDELNAKRQEVRDKINEIQQQIEEVSNG